MSGSGCWVGRRCSRRQPSVDIDKRKKALERVVRLLFIAEDERSPEGERSAAQSRAEAIVERYEFTEPELRAAVRADVESRQPRRPQPQPWPAMQGWTVVHPVWATWGTHNQWSHSGSTMWEHVWEE